MGSSAATTSPAGSKGEREGGERRERTGNEQGTEVKGVASAFTFFSQRRMRGRSYSTICVLLSVTKYGEM
jgi:hypothetical protein